MVMLSELYTEVDLLDIGTVVVRCKTCRQAPLVEFCNGDRTIASKSGMSSRDIHLIDKLPKYMGHAAQDQKDPLDRDSQRQEPKTADSCRYDKYLATLCSDVDQAFSNRIEIS